MKAKINVIGALMEIEAEGTPQEIAELIRKVNGEERVKYAPVPQWPPFKPEITCADGRINPYVSTLPSSAQYDVRG
ncbi:hypothetical protein G5B47_02135 [Paenibacillus sp. 7124]|uniref:Uncharacterized protein n=1 Tax=Paenibacillus apii TaxID=1850370 RepID=A0A6M1PDF3_9BACL|nr:hypothetical protein [Paenibacillus apii]NGM81206.1 hypothetical protein [Paenibacillus apii]